MRERILNTRATWKLFITEPVSQNYYPINAAAYIQDGATRLTVLTDRSQGGGSLLNGEMEVMVHRRTLQDDNRGVGEPINEPGISGTGLIIKGVHRVIFASPARSAILQRSLSMQMATPVRLAFAALPEDAGTFAKTHLTSVSAVQAEVPANVNLQTMEVLSTGEILLRLAHQFETHEVPSSVGPQSQPVNIDLAALLPKHLLITRFVRFCTPYQFTSQYHNF
jgi:hypothetical protein